MSIQETVRAAWLKRFNKNSELKEKEKSQERAKKKRKTSPSITQNVISLLSDDEDDDSLQVMESNNLVKELDSDRPKEKSVPHTFKPFHNPTYDTYKLSNSITIKDLIGSPNITKSFLFSFQYSLPFILDVYGNKSAQITIIYQDGTVLDSPLRSSYNISLIKVEMPPYSSHHPKIIINFYDDSTLKIFLISANLTEAEFRYNNQFSWESPFLYKKNSTSTQFKTNLLDWLKKYQKPLLNTTLIKELEKYDFSPIIGDFIGSSSGTFKDSGLLSLFDSLQRLDLLISSYDTETQILYQSSSISAPFSATQKGSANLFTHLLTPLIMNQKFPINNGVESLNQFLKKVNTKLFCIYPSLIDIQESKFGYDSGGWSHFNPFSKTGSKQVEYLKNIFYHPYSEQRKTNTNHTKFIIVSKDNFKTLEWVLFTSANLSNSAWGKLKKDGNVYITNYETGILISNKHYEPKKVKLIPVTIGENKLLKDDEIPIELPFVLPPKKYSDSDEPWVITMHNT